MKIRILTSIILLICSNNLFAQIYDNEQASSSIKWRQIDEQNFRLIYPISFESTALSLAQQLNQFIKNASDDLKIKPRKISIILQSNHVNPNGFVQLAPRKSEFNTTPSNSSDNFSWLSNLALHELRHVAQFDKLTGKLKSPFLETLAFALFGLNLPSWYFEGDAVYIESVYSNGGRGRMPSWNMPLRTNLNSNRNYSFDKYILGSYKDIVPSYYTIGYFLNTHLENTQKDDAKANIMDNMRRHLLRPYNFNKALKKETGYKSNSLFRATIDSLKILWKDTTAYNTNHYLKTPSTKYQTSYLLPQISKNQEVFALQISPQKTPQIVKIVNGKAARVMYTGQQTSSYFDLQGDYLAWDEYRRDARFSKQSYQIINLYNYKTKELKTISKNSRYYSPIIHPNLTQIAVVNVDLANHYSIKFIDIGTKKVLDTIAIPGLTQLIQPRFNSAGTKIIAIAIDDRGTNLLQIDLLTKSLNFLLDWGNQQLERPNYAENDIIFKAHYQGKDQLYKLKTSDKSLSILSNEEFGAFNPTYTLDNNIIYNGYQYDGYHIAKIPVKSQPIPSSILANFNSQIKNIPYQSPLNDTSKVFQTKKYNPITDFFNFHSLTVSDNNFENFDNYRPGIFWQANDLLNTSQLKVGYEYDLEKQKDIYSVSITYQKYYPKLKISYENKGEIGQASVSGTKDSTINFDFRQQGVYVDINLPFALFRRNYIYSFGANLGTSYVNRYQLSLTQLKNFNSDIIFPLNYQVYLNRNSLKSKMDLAPKWGQNLSVVYRHLPFEKQMNGELISVMSNFYFPGLVTNHSLQIRLALQESSGQYQYSYDIPLVSGFGYFNSPKVKNTMMINYRFPIAYPDWALGSVSYIKRIQGLFFSDHQNLEDNKFTPKSFGVGLSADLHFFRFPLPDFNAGTRIIYVNDASSRQKIIPTFSFTYSY